MKSKYNELVGKMKEMYLTALTDLTYAGDKYDVEESYDNLLIINENTGIIWALEQLLENGVVSQEEKEMAIQKGHDEYSR